MGKATLKTSHRKEDKLSYILKFSRLEDFIVDNLSLSSLCSQSKKLKKTNCPAIMLATIGSDLNFAKYFEI